MHDHQRHLSTYLNDHLAASVGGIQLTKRCLNSNRGEDLEKFLRQFLEEITQEQRQLQKILQALGSGESFVKQAGVWVLEKLGRLKLNNKLLAYSDLSRLVELEALLAGVNAKVDMWRILESLDFLPSLSPEIDLTALRQQGERQIRGLRRECLRAGQRAFSPHP